MRHRTAAGVGYGAGYDVLQHPLNRFTFINTQISASMLARAMKFVMYALLYATQLYII